MYRDPEYYCAFPSAAVCADGSAIVAFRRAPDRRLTGGRVSHVDAESTLVLVRSSDGGRAWADEPEPIHAHPSGGLQDPCLLALADGSLICSAYGWAPAPENEERKSDTIRLGGYVHMGGLLLRSRDRGRTWAGPIIPPPPKGTAALDHRGRPCPAFNRGAMVQGADGRLLWAVTCHDSLEPLRVSVQLLASGDGGATWDYLATIAGADRRAAFNETSLYLTPRGDLLAFMRSWGLDDHTAVARSSDGGRSFAPWLDAGFRGHPHHALRLSDESLLLVHGYRHPPFGIRARVLDPECLEPRASEEIILRDDGGNADIGYPWAALLPDGRVLVVYYFNVDDEARYIAGSLLTFS